MTLTVNADRLRADLEHLATIGGASNGSVNRPAFSTADVAARRWYAERAEESGVPARMDGLLNVILGEDTRVPAIWTGSHLDTVPDGGMFDGALGAVAALECLRRLHEENVELPRPVRGIAFSDEEGSYLGFLGSKGFIHGLDQVDTPHSTPFAEMKGIDGRTLSEAVAGAGGELASVVRPGVDPDNVHGFVELHIEQGPALEAAGTHIGVVSDIVGVGRMRVQFNGRPDHAGTTPMSMRRDALRAAAAFIDRLAEIPASIGHPDSVVTCGDLVVRPGASNVVPSQATAYLDYRASSTEVIALLKEALLRHAHACGARHSIQSVCEPEHPTPPVALDENITKTIQNCAQEQGLRTAVMPSGAGHDAQVVAEVAPTGMIFVPSRDGRSHSRLESTSWEDVTNGANVLLNTLIALASS